MPTSSIRICWPSSTPNRPTRRSFPDWRRAAFALIYRSLTRRPGSRWQVGNGLLEESPGSRETGRRLMAARREPRESATESKPPLLHGAVRVKGWGKSPPRDWRQDRHGKPRPEQDRIGGAHGPFSARAPGVSREVPGNRHPRGMAARPEQSGEQNPAYRPSGLFPGRAKRDNSIEDRIEGKKARSASKGYTPMTLRVIIRSRIE